jgi:hypothetical protein
MKRATIAMEDKRMNFLTFKSLDGWGNQKPLQIVEKIGIPPLTREPRTGTTTNEEWLGQGRKKGIVPVGGSSRDKWACGPTGTNEGLLVSVGSSNRD